MSAVVWLLSLAGDHASLLGVLRSIRNQVEVNEIFCDINMSLFGHSE